MEINLVERVIQTINQFSTRGMVHRALYELACMYSVVNETVLWLKLKPFCAIGDRASFQNCLLTGFNENQTIHLLTNEMYVKIVVTLFAFAHKLDDWKIHIKLGDARSYAVTFNKDRGVIMKKNGSIILPCCIPH